MSGHSKWHSIKHKKGAEDARRGKIFTKHAKLVAIAARGGGDPNMNPSLRMAIDNARAENMPRENIERAIKKGTGEGKGAAVMEEVMYEGFGQGGAALYIETLTDNRNRTVTNLKYAIGKNGGNLGAAGSVGYLFKKKGRITIPLKPEIVEDKFKKTVPVPQKSLEEIELAAIDAGAEDVKFDGPIDEKGNPADDAFVEVYTEPHDLMKVRGSLEKAGIKTKSAALTYLPQTTVAISEEQIARELLDLINVIEEDEDVNEVFSNFEIAEAVLEKLV
ncbi:MAG: YebC/PmpR family DNA-binding transcriptional regulator [Candidatus Gracilibacteria bacterium]|jgi:YebC/PmpR family DNA-binding regulatory protein